MKFENTNQAIKSYLFGLFGIFILGVLTSGVIDLFLWIFRAEGYAVVALTTVIYGLIFGAYYIGYKLTGNKLIFLYLPLYWASLGLYSSFPADYFLTSLLPIHSFSDPVQNVLGFVILWGSAMFLPYALVHLFTSLVNLKKYGQVVRPSAVISLLGALLIFSLFIASSHYGKGLAQSTSQKRHYIYVPATDEITTNPTEVFVSGEEYYFRIYYPAIQARQPERDLSRTDELRILPVKNSKETKKACGTSWTIRNDSVPYVYSKILNLEYGLATHTSEESNKNSRGLNYSYHYCFVIGEYKYYFDRDVSYGETTDSEVPREKVLEAIINGKRLVYGCAIPKHLRLPEKYCRNEDVVQYGPR